MLKDNPTLSNAHQEVASEVYPHHETWSDYNLPIQEEFDIHQDCFGFEDSSEEDYDQNNPYAGYEPDFLEEDYDEQDEFDLLDAKWVKNTTATLDYISDKFFKSGKGKRVRMGNITPSSLIYLG